MQLRLVNKNQNRFEINLAVTSSLEVTMRMHEVRSQFRGRPSEVTMNMHKVKGWDYSLEVKTQLKVTRAHN